MSGLVKFEDYQPVPPLADDEIMQNVSCGHVLTPDDIASGIRVGPHEVACPLREECDYMDSKTHAWVRRRRAASRTLVERYGQVAGAGWVPASATSHARPHSIYR